MSRGTFRNAAASKEFIHRFRTEAAAAANLEKYGPFAATERVMMALVRAGGDRQRAHERLRDHSLKAWAAIKAGRPNPLGASLAGDPDFLVYLQPARLRELMDARAYVGTAVERAAAMAETIRAALTGEPEARVAVR